MKKFIISFCTINLILITNLSAQQTDTTQTINDVVIQETYESDWSEEKLPINIDLSYAEVVNIPERINWASVDKENSISKEEKWDNYSFKFSSPEFVNIYPEPVKTFNAQFKNLSSWKLDIITSNGKLFKSIEGEGNPSETITWDGKSNDDEKITPGLNYSYSFTAIDKAGNKRVFPGQTFSVPAVYLMDNESVWIGIAEDKLFSNDGFGLLNQAEDYCKEVASLIRYYSKKGKISIGCSHANGKDFIKLLEKCLSQNEKYFTITELIENQNNLIVMIE